MLVHIICLAAKALAICRYARKIVLLNFTFDWKLRYPASNDAVHDARCSFLSILLLFYDPAFVTLTQWTSASEEKNNSLKSISNIYELATRDIDWTATEHFKRNPFCLHKQNHIDVFFGILQELCKWSNLNFPHKRSVIKIYYNSSNKRNHKYNVFYKQPNQSAMAKPTEVTLSFAVACTRAVPIYTRIWLESNQLRRRCYHTRNFVTAIVNGFALHSTGRTILGDELLLMHTPFACNCTSTSLYIG